MKFLSKRSPCFIAIHFKILMTLSHMLYHFNGLDDIREKIRLALTLLKPGGNFAIILNQPSAPMALIGIGFQRAAGRRREAATNLDLHACCHESRFYQALAGRQAEVASRRGTPG